MTIKKEPDDNIYCHQAPGYSAKIVKTIPYSIHIEKNNQEQYSDHPKNLKNHNVNRTNRIHEIYRLSIKSDVLKLLSGNIFTFLLFL